LRDELVRRDYAPSTIRSYVQILGAFRKDAGTLLMAYLNVVDRQVRLAQLGLDRRVRNVTDTFDAALAREPEAR
jgi:hypothetical protein